MKICTTTHRVPSFGEIPEGSLWADDSPYVVEADLFRDVLDEKPAQPVKPKKRAPRKFGQHPIVQED